MKSLIQYQMAAFTVLAIAHLLAMFDLDYGYYVLLRWITFIDSIIIIVLFHKIEKENFWNFITIIYIVVGIIWNPFSPIYQSRDGWFILNLIVGLGSAFFAYSTYSLMKKIND